MAPAQRFGHGYRDDQLARLLGPYAEVAGPVGTRPFNLGWAHDFRVPDHGPVPYHGYHRAQPDPATVYLPTATVVVEIVSPDDGTYEKVPFCLAHGADEIVVVEADHQLGRVMLPAYGGYRDAQRSTVLGPELSWLQEALRWP